MNWMQASLGRWSANTLLLGGIAGAWGALLYHAALWLTGGMEPGVLPAALVGLAFGAGLCGGLALVGELINRFPRRALKAGLFGVALGMATGAAAFLLLELAAVPSISAGEVEIPVGGYGAWMGVPLLMGLLGGAAGFGSGFAAAGRLRNSALRRIVAGCGSGLAAGVPFALLLAVFREVAWVMPLACAAWGAVVAFAIFWGEKRFARRWLRVLTGPGEDNFYPLTAPWITLGKLESNDIPLLDYHEVFPFHCRLKWENDHYQIADGDQGGMVLVNYRQISEQTLKPGDLVKLGTALLQYGEASR